MTSSTFVLNVDDVIDVCAQCFVRMTFCTKNPATQSSEAKMLQEQGERVLNSLANRISELDSIIEKNHQTDIEDTRAYVESMKNKNTKRKTSADVKKFQEWLQHKSREERPIYEISPKELNLYLSRYFMTIKKNDDTEYEPDSLKSMQASIHRYLMENDYEENIFSSDSFRHHRDVLQAKRKELKSKGLGNKKRKADPFTDDEIDLLYEKNLLGVGNPDSLIRTVWLNNTMQFGLRGVHEHTSMLWGDLELKKTSAGAEYIEFTERATKTRSGITSDCRIYIPKMIADPGNPNCPVAVYKEYVQRRSENALKPEARFYLQINRNRKTGEQWYKDQPMGKNTIAGFVKQMGKNEEVSLSGNKSNHSARKTSVTKLVHKGVAPQQIMQLTGHKNVQSINSYSIPSLEQQRDMSSMLCYKSKNVKAETTSTSCPVPYDIETDVSDEELIKSSQEIENVLTDINNYEITNIENKENHPSIVDIPPVVDLPFSINENGVFQLIMHRPPCQYHRKPHLHVFWCDFQWHCKRLL